MSPPDTPTGRWDPSFSRVVWRSLETINAVTYFAPEPRAAGRTLGLRGFWMGYFASRAAPMGAVAAATVEATFFNFHPAMVRRAIPDAWALTTPERVLAMRGSAAAAALRRLIPADEAAFAELLALLRPVIAASPGAGRPLFAANRELPPSGDAVADVWQAATTLREHRGDGHVAVLVEAELDGCEAHVLYAATELAAPEVLRDNRGWSPDEWDDTVARLQTRGLLDRDGRPTEAGQRCRERVERRTDELAGRPYRAIGDEIDELLRLAQRLARPVASSGEIPFPNPMGLPRPGEPR